MKMKPCLLCEASLNKPDRALRGDQYEARANSARGLPDSSRR